MKAVPDDYLTWLRAGTLTWSGYFLLLMFADWQLSESGTLSIYYWLYYGSAIVVLSTLAFLPGLPDRLGGLFPILILTLMAVLPIIGVSLILPMAGTRSLFVVVDSPYLYSRNWFPEFLVATLLAYGYHVAFLVLFVVVVAAQRVAVALLALDGPAQQTAVLLTLIVAFISLTIGLIVNLAFRKLRRQQEALETANRELVAFASTAQELAISRERVRVARDLHDTLAHSLSGLIVQLEIMEGYWDVDRLVSHDLLEQAQQTARDGLRETRRALKALRASPLDELGLLLALRVLAESTAEKSETELILALPTHLPPLPTETEQCIYRVAQEAMNNVVHHARGQSLEVRLLANPDRIRLIVCDDGIGFEPDQVTEPLHFGLSGMKERATLAGGTLEIHTEPDQGSTIVLELPLKTRKASS